jgi:hypothetical protein
MTSKRRVTRFLLADVTQRARIVKLKTEIAVIDHELETLQCAFGVSFYDAMEEHCNSTTMTELPEAIATAYQECKTLIDSKREEQTKRHDAIDANQSQRLRAAPSTSLAERAKSLADAVTSRSVDAKCQLENMWLDRAVLREKQVFGRLIFDTAVLEPADDGGHYDLPNESLQLIIDEYAEKAADPRQRKAEKVLQIAALEATIEQAWPKDNNDDQTVTTSKSVQEEPAEVVAPGTATNTLSEEQ